MAVLDPSSEGQLDGADLVLHHGRFDIVRRSATDTSCVANTSFNARASEPDRFAARTSPLAITPSRACSPFTSRSPLLLSTFCGTPPPHLFICQHKRRGRRLWMATSTQRLQHQPKISAMQPSTRSPCPNHNRPYRQERSRVRQPRISLGVTIVAPHSTQIGGFTFVRAASSCGTT